MNIATPCFTFVVKSVWKSRCVRSYVMVTVLIVAFWLVLPPPSLYLFLSVTLSWKVIHVSDLCGRQCMSVQKELFTLGKETILCNGEHSSFAVHGKTIVRSNMSTVWQLSLPQHCWSRIMESLPKLHKGMQPSNLFCRFQICWSCSKSREQSSSQEATSHWEIPCILWKPMVRSQEPTTGSWSSSHPHILLL